MALSTQKITNIKLNAVFNATGSIGYFAVVFFLAPFVIKYIGIEAWGVWQLVTAVTGYLLLLNLGLESSVNHEVSKASAADDMSRLGSAINCARLYFILGAALFVTFILIVVDMLSRKLVPIELQAVAHTTMVVSIGITAVAFIMRTYPSVVAGMQRYDLLGKFRIIQALVILVVILAIGSDLTLLLFAIVMSFSPLVTSILSWLFYRKHIPAVNRRFQKLNQSQFLDMLKYGIGTISFTFGTAILFQSMKIIASAQYGGVEYAAHMGLVISLAMIISTIFQPLLTVLLPRISALVEKEEWQTVSGLVSRALHVSSVLVCIIITFLWINAEVVFSVWLGTSLSQVTYIQLAEVLRVILLGQGAYVICLTGFFSLAGVREHNRLGIGLIITGVISVVVSWLIGGEGRSLIYLAYSFSLSIVLFCFVFVIPYVIKRFNLCIKSALFDVFLVPIMIVAPGALLLGYTSFGLTGIKGLIFDGLLYVMAISPGIYIAFKRLSNIKQAM